MRRGYVRLWRCSEDSAVWQDDRLWRLWCHLVMHARYDDGWVSIDGLAKPIPVLRGQLMVGRMAIHKSLYPKKRKYTPSPSTVWRRLQTLRDMGNITLEMNSRFTMVTICNYDTYNSVQLQNEQVNEQPVNSRRTAGEQPTDTKKKEKKVKKVEEGKKEASCTEPDKPASEQKATYSADFETWWKSYPRKVGKGKAFAAWKIATKTMQADRLLAITEQYAKSPAGNAGQFTPHPNTWLAQARYDDDPTEWQKERDNGKQHPTGPGQKFPTGSSGTEGVF